MRWSYLVLAIAVLASLWVEGAARAEDSRDVATWRGTWNGAYLSVTVIAVDHLIPDEVKHTEPWWRWGNTEKDAYLFSFNSEEEVDLMLVFTVEQGRPRATLYVLDEERQRKDVQIRDGRIILPENTHPYAIIWPREGDWLVEGRANFDLEVDEIDRNGSPIWHTSVGADSPGAPKWVTRRLLRDLFPSEGYNRFGATAREDPSVTYILATPLMPAWPYLSVAKSASHWGEDRPMLFDPTTHVLTMSWAGFQTAGVYSFNSICPPPQTCFESPFAWYRFDPAAGNYANLVIRSDRWPKGVTFGPSGPEFERTTLRMTWTAKDYSLWRYSLTVTGDYPMDEQVLIGDATIESIPYADLPPWIGTRDWKAITFVEATKGEPGSEGIYDYSVEDNPLVSDWVNGLRAQPPASFESPPLGQRPTGPASPPQEPSASFPSPYLRYPRIHPNRLYNGFRGEYSLAYNRTPQLYLSPIDNRVHLLFAEGGLWNLGDGLVLRTLNLGNGPYINGWVRERLPLQVARITDEITLAVPGEAEEQLFALDGYLIYSGGAMVELRQAETMPLNVEVPVPVDEANWQSFLNRTEPARTQEHDPGDLRSWFESFPDETLRIVGATASGIRRTQTGFRFMLDVLPGSDVQGADLFGIRRSPAGRYVITYNRADGTYTAVPATPPSIRISSPPGGILLEFGIQARPNSIALSVENTGLEDIKELRIALNATNKSGRSVLVADRRLTVLAGEPTRAVFPWTPPDAGEWTIEAITSLADDADEPDEETITHFEYEEKVQIAGPGLPTVSQSVAAFDIVPAPAIIGLLVAILSIASIITVYLYKS